MQNPNVVAIGGLGGSGTRVIAEILCAAGFYIGDTLNQQLDNLWFTLLLKRPGWFAGQPADEDIKIALGLFQQAMTTGLSATAGDADIALLDDLMNQLEASGIYTGADRRVFDALLASKAPRMNDYIGWGWKEPNSHIFLPQIVSSVEKPKYIHVIRHGLDMAFSKNQQQLKNWSPAILGTNFDPDGFLPQQSLDYWIAANQRVVSLGAELLGPENFLLVNYDRLCAFPKRNIEEVLAFIDASISSAHMNTLLQNVVPTSIGRFRQFPMESFTNLQLDAVAEFGFDISTD